MFTTLVQPGLFLRRALIADAAVSAAVGALMGFGADALQAPLGLPASMLAIAGALMLPYVLYLAWLATRRSVPQIAVWLPIALNLLWAVDCAIALVGPALQPTALGRAFIGVQIVAVLAFAELEFIGLRRALSSPRAAPAHRPHAA